ncbi:bile acid:sodium symporter family protein [Sporomusa acidovorans]|uniref:Pantothenates transporter PanS n=1 Tax=Sporomusa acidovorans (strain ATCC 49682 / DSM 3132 / Mol) TaxID=1123286 RepID=A0ABZ3J8Z2_SPOA4|nr:bile acid:sodium symporter family protein [Sporomusa acidovorans]OZC16203.1 sodium bile acid symporter family protein [Sporomusa acidovorans DSM 3132]SDE31204.1 bile acid:Na+ symporter, BASS family [Sporomusa acidovorans]
MRYLERLAQFICKNMTLWVVILSAIAFFYPAPFKPIGKYISYLLGVIMLGMGLTMSLEDFRLVLTRPKDVFYGVFFRYLIMPLVGFGAAKLLGLPPALAAGMVLLGAAPSGTGSNVMTYIAKGDTALSITVSSINTILAPVLTTYIFSFLAGSMIPIDVGALLLDIVKIVLVPVAAGVVLHMLVPSLVEKLAKVVPAVSVIFIVAIIASVVALNSAKLATMAFILFVAVVIHNTAGLLLGYYAGRTVGMSRKKSRAITFEIGMENSGLAVALALAHLDPMAALPAAVMTVWEYIAGSLLASYWGNKPVDGIAAPAGEAIAAAK